MKKIKVIDMEDLNFKAGGAHGSYYTLNRKVGIKILSDCYYSSLSEVKKVIRSSDASEEFKCLKTAYSKSKNGLLPKALFLVIVKERLYDDRHKEYVYYIGYAMQHINGTILSKKRKSYRESVIKKLFADLASKGIYHSDLHSENIIISNRKPYAIDFDPSFVSFEYCPAKYGG